MKKVVIYPINNNDTRLEYDNPFINDLSKSIVSAGFEVLKTQNKKNPLINLLTQFIRADLIVLNWLESVIAYRFGLFQFVASIVFLFLTKLFNKKVIWIYHNKLIHNHRELPQWKVKCAIWVQRLGVQIAYKIIGFTDEVNNFISSKFHIKTLIFNHPIKENRLQTSSNRTCTYDYLIWGEISPYKGIVDFLKYRKTNPELQSRNILIVGSCKDQNLKEQIKCFSDEHTQIEIRKISNDELKELVLKVKFCLITHLKSSILSSATLMDSISFGFKVIGPNCGAFNDLSKDLRLDVRVYNDFNEILEISKEERKMDLDYIAFIRENTWAEFSKILGYKILD